MSEMAGANTGMVPSPTKYLLKLSIVHTTSLVVSLLTDDEDVQVVSRPA